jgi:hypothetical protein
VAALTEDEETAPDETSAAARALSLLAWPLALLGPLGVWNVVVAAMAATAPDVVVDVGCDTPWGACQAPLVDIITSSGSLGQALVVLLGGGLAMAVVRGTPVRRRLSAVLVLLAAEALFLTLVGITVLQIGEDLG